MRITVIRRNVRTHIFSYTET